MPPRCPSLPATALVVVALLLPTAESAHALPASVAGPASPPLVAAAWADLDADGRPELVAAARRGVPLVLADPGSGLAPLPGAWNGPDDGTTTRHLAVGDLDGDGFDDVVACGRAPAALDHGACRIARGAAAPPRLEPATGAGATVAATGLRRPVLVDFDGDLDLDVILFATGRPAAPVLFVNRTREDDATGDLVLVPSDAVLPASRARAVAVAGRDGNELVVANSAGADQLLVYDEGTSTWSDQADQLGLLSPSGVRFRLQLAVADFDGNGLDDIAALGRRSRLFIHFRQADGSFVELAADTGATLPALRPAALVAADFDRDGRPDLLAFPARGRPTLLANRGAARRGDPPLLEATPLDGFEGARRTRDAAAAAVPGDCDDAIDLAVAARDDEAALRIARFADDSTAHRIVAADGEGETVATGATTCLDAAPSGSRLVGHLRRSVLAGGPGNDTLVARSGVTVLRGGPGADRFVAGGTTIVRLPVEDVVPGETIACSPGSLLLLDTPLTREELEREGVLFEGCFDDGDCPPASDEHHDEDPTHGEDGEALDAEPHGHCHGARSRVAFGVHRTAGGAVPGDYARMSMMLKDRERPEPFYDGPGVGSCDEDADCARHGLEYCRTEDGDVPEPCTLHPKIDNGCDPGDPVEGQCYPSTFSGDAAVAEWCNDPFFARNKAAEVTSSLQATGDRIVIPVTFWLLRSDALVGDICNDVGATPATRAQWHESVTKGMGAAIAAFSPWGVTFSYQFKTIVVPSDGPFAQDADPCLSDLVFGTGAPGDAFDEEEPNRVEDLVLWNAFSYKPAAVNVYLTDSGPAGVGEASSFTVGDYTHSFTLLHGNGGALTHELAHVLGLPHPYDGNLAPSGTNEGTEARENWLRRPFPGAAPDANLAACTTNSDCNATDAGPGRCAIAPGRTAGYCRNLKIDCANDGDGICDTPWDSRPCFSGRGFYNEPCSVDADCAPNESWLGVSGLFQCESGRCLPRTCDENSDCESGLCAGGRCANTFHLDERTCCDLHSDLATGRVHNACWEDDGNGGARAVPGIGNTTVWPEVTTELSYNMPVDGVGAMFTPGQRDRTICRLAFTTKWGKLVHRQAAAGEPCSLSKGAVPSSYGFVHDARPAAHGACRAGACLVNSFVPPGEARCMPASCNNGILDGGESDVDCGGTCPDACEPLDRCRDDNDCTGGWCFRNVCQPTCGDGKRNGTERSIDEGGSGFTPGCGGRELGESCRFDTDCGAAMACDGDRNCVDASDCPINQTSDGCQSNADCPGGTCVADEVSSCADNPCALPDGSGCCDRAGDCPGSTCLITTGRCVGACVDGRCLGECTPEIVLP